MVCTQQQNPPLSDTIASEGGRLARCASQEVATPGTLPGLRLLETEALGCWCVLAQAERMLPPTPSWEWEADASQASKDLRHSPAKVPGKSQCSHKQAWEFPPDHCGDRNAPLLKTHTPPGGLNPGHRSPGTRSQFLNYPGQHPKEADAL